MSMNKKTRSLINTRYEAQKIYYQRREIKKKDQQITQLTNNWNELEEYIKNENSNYVPLDSYVDGTNATYEEILDKMKEIKEGK